MDASTAQLQQIIAGPRAVPVQVDIKVVPVQDEGKSIGSISKGSKSPIDIDPEVRQGNPERINRDFCEAKQFLTYEDSFGLP